MLESSHRALLFWRKCGKRKIQQENEQYLKFKVIIRGFRFPKQRRSCNIRTFKRSTKEAEIKACNINLFMLLSMSELNNFITCKSG
jgi:hypothetical protein